MPVLNAECSILLALALHKCFPDGAHRRNSLGGSHEITSGVVKALQYVAQKAGSKLWLALEDEKRPGISGSVVVSLVIHVPGKTWAVPMKLSPGLRWLADQPYYLDQPDAATDLVDAVIHEVETVIDARTASSRH